MDQVRWQRHISWEQFLAYAQPRHRLILLTTKTTTPYTSLRYEEEDMLLLGRESAGVPEAVATACSLSATIPMAGQTRSLNVALATAMVLGEAVRQLRT